jgi:malonyl-CoA O-methyltransferase
LQARLQYLKINPQVILDLGCGLAQSTKALKKIFPKAQVIGIDCSMQMLKLANSRRYFWNKLPFVQADVMQLPIASESVDLIFSNQLLHWLPDTSGFFKECFRVLKPQACLLFSSLGPDTFKEFRQVFVKIDQFQHVHDFIDLHDIGDQLLSEDFLDPVMDREDLQINYTSPDALLQALRHQGVRNYSSKRSKGLMSKKKWQTLWEYYPTVDGKWPVTYEIVYGHAWRANVSRGTGEHSISIEKLRSSLPSLKKG